MFFFCWVSVNGTNSREDTLSYLPIGFSRGRWMYSIMYSTYVFICHRNKVSLSSLYLLTISYNLIVIGVILYIQRKEKDYISYL